MSVRRAYNIVRQSVESEERLTFEEFAILCRLCEAGAPMKTSAIAEYQGALRPTMTHRTNRLFSLGLIERTEGSEDRRNVVCAVSERGRERVMELAELTRSQIPTGKALSRTSAERVCKYADAMGSLYCKAGDLVLLGLHVAGKDLSIMELVDMLGLLQPTISMSVQSLAQLGLVEREQGAGTRAATVGLTSAGEARAVELVEKIGAIVVRRRPRDARRADAEA